jgi:hypothetical protein
MVQISVNQSFGHVDVLQLGDFDHHECIIGPVNVSAHPVDGQTLAIVDAGADDHLAFCAVQLPPLDRKPRTKIVYLITPIWILSSLNSVHV